MNETFREKVAAETKNDDDVQFYWCLLSGNMDQECSEKLLELLINKYITIRGFSFAKSLMEIYKDTKKEPKRPNHSDAKWQNPQMTVILTLHNITHNTQYTMSVCCIITLYTCTVYLYISNYYLDGLRCLNLLRSGLNSMSSTSIPFFRF